MEPNDVTIHILREIRDEVHHTNERLDQTNERLDKLTGRVDETNGRIDTLREELSRRIVESEIRTSTAITELAGTVQEMTRVLRTTHDLRPRVERCEQDIVELRRQIGQR
jgi:chromosome segregation ATPase